MFAVSIAVAHRDRLEHAVIYDPMRQELFTATRGVGAQLDGRKIRVSSQRNLESALIGTGFPFRGKETWLDSYMPMLKAVIASTAGVRRPGAASLDLAYVAAGRLDGFWELGLQPWDMAAGSLLVQEAGGIVTSLSGNDDYVETGQILTGNSRIHDALSAILTPLLPTESA